MGTGEVRRRATGIEKDEDRCKGTGRSKTPAVGSKGIHTSPFSPSTSPCPSHTPSYSSSFPSPTLLRHHLLLPVLDPAMVGLIRIWEVWLDLTAMHAEFHLWVTAALSSASPPECLWFPRTYSAAPLLILLQ
ncbi:Os02g0635300 [Oryza sativa Japonica Group]|uniref:Os02g0635333 protein n=2 Tax=Oryza sativa subsp. japonica TaxID=39947 RepID=C7IYX3_ORYSJ|nr:hypothetical protein EE612_012582 [Oryza sativa]BAD25101.1 hypothetical protein [Oryza sativa Japonica Group]BAH91819.1 Os02g0635333 [Oryza sativa Japonica Group]BAS79937.1 Os02g0635300 [Oryza sativa Japonica Group]|eukprot:NP_001173090.1 Os02g0635333 [Oryza sativa Japonica Group]